MAKDSGAEFSFMNNRRSAVNTARLPGFGLGLPLAVVASGLLFALLCAALGHQTYGSLQALDPPTAMDSHYYATLIEEQVSSALIAVAVLASIYAVGLVGAWFWYARRMMGPEVAFRRHVEALKNGDYKARVKLRDGDAFLGLAQDLNDLAMLLGADEKPDERHSLPPEA